MIPSSLDSRPRGSEHLRLSALRWAACLVVLPALLYLVHPDSVPGGFSELVAGTRQPIAYPPHDASNDGWDLRLDSGGLDEKVVGAHTDGHWGLLDFNKWVGGQNSRRNVLVTGGAGQLGLALLPRLAEHYTVHVLDISPRPREFPDKHAVYHRGSVLSPSTALHKLLSSVPFDGVIHLAAVSLDAWCAPKELDCLAVNEGGISNLLFELDATRSQSGLLPWVILGSSMDVFEHRTTTVDEKTLRIPETALGRTKARAEEVLESTIADLAERAKRHEQPAACGDIRSDWRAITLRFSTIYGYPIETTIPDAFYPALISDAITSLPIQYDLEDPAMDLLHYQDAVEGVLAAVEQLEVATSGFYAAVNLVAGQQWTVEETVNTVRRLAGSHSPMQDLGDHTVQPGSSVYSNALASSLLSWSPNVTLANGVRQSVIDITHTMKNHALSHLHSGCSATAEFPSSRSHTHPADERNKDLDKLDGCQVNIAFQHESFLHHLRCADDQHCVTNGTNAGMGFNWNATTWTAHAEHRKHRKVTIRLEEEKGLGWLGMQEAAGNEGEVRWGLVKEDDPEWETSFNLEVASDSSHLSLSLASTGQHVHPVANVSTGTDWFTLGSPGQHDPRRFDMRMSVLCCPSEGDWPLLLDDYVSADTRFGSTGQIPFNASRRSHTCSRALKAARYAASRIEALSHHDDFALVNTASEKLPEMSDQPRDWTLRELPPCWNDCSSPLICVQTGSCRCVQGECPLRRENPILTLKRAEKPRSTVYSELEGDAGGSSTLIEDVSRLSLEDILLPAARHYLAKHPNLIKVYVADGYRGQEAIEGAKCHSLQKKHCFSADSVLYKAMRSMQVPAEEADLIVLPVYQNCFDAGNELHTVLGFAKEAVPGVRNGEKRVSVIMTHDWGICMRFVWEIWEARNDTTFLPDWPMQNMLVMQVMGDYDSACYRPHQDIVIPARSCQSTNLKKHFGDLADVKPMRERTKLLTWAGTHWGTGRSDRQRLTCGRGGAGDRELVAGGGKQSVFFDWDYMKDLSDARFCPTPRGIAGWSPRTNDAIYAGCIPVIISDSTHYPFASFLDWTRFSVRIQPTELDRIEQILESISLDKVEELQANLAIVREAFLYSPDEAPEEETKRKGPMWFALHELGMRMRTKWPTAGRPEGELRPHGP